MPKVIWALYIIFSQPNTGFPLPSFRLAVWCIQNTSRFIKHWLGNQVLINRYLQPWSISREILKNEVRTRIRNLWVHAQAPTSSPRVLALGQLYPNSLSPIICHLFHQNNWSRSSDSVDIKKFVFRGLPCCDPCIPKICEVIKICRFKGLLIHKLLTAFLTQRNGSSSLKHRNNIYGINCAPFPALYLSSPDPYPLGACPGKLQYFNTPTERPLQMDALYCHTYGLAGATTVRSAEPKYCNSPKFSQNTSYAHKSWKRHRGQGSMMPES